MKFTFKTMFIPICLVVMLVTQLIDYFLTGEINLFIVATACFVTPAAIKGLKPEYADSVLSKVFPLVGLVIMSIGFYMEFIK